VLAQTIRRVASALSVAIVIAMVASASAGAAAGTITEYPIPVETTPYGITTGPDGKLWFVDSGNHAGGTFVGRMATNGAISSSEVVQLPSPKLGQAITPGPDGNMWVVQDGQIDKVPVGVSLTSEITPDALGSGTGGYGSITPGPDGRLWFGWNQKVGAITTAGTIEGYETKSASSVSGVTVGPDGKLWFGEGNAIARMDTTGHTGAGDEFPLPPFEGQINGLVLGPDGNIWFSLGVPAAVGRITPAGTITIFPTPTLNSLPFGLAVGPDKKIWFAESNGNAIGTIPTTATSGADIVEYPLAFSNTNPLYITAGPDGRMWFNEFNRGALGAITTNTAPSGPPSGGESPPGSPPPGSRPPGSPPRGETPLGSPPLGPPPLGVPLPALPSEPPPVGCAANRLILTDVFPQAGRTQVLGVAPAAAIGKTVTILSTWNGKPVASAIVRTDMSFKATVALPPRSLRFTNGANYVAKLGSARSGALKFSRRMYTTSITTAGRAITFSGNVTRPFARRIEPVTIRVAASCTAIAAGTIAAKVNLTRSGSFSATFQLPASLQGAPKVYLLAQTRVRQNQHSSKTYPTSTLIRGVQLAS
jgi:virginiamycin B lyase